MSEEIIIEAISKLTLKDGDTLVLKVHRSVTTAEMRNLHGSLSTLMNRLGTPNRCVVVLESDMELQVLESNA